MSDISPTFIWEQANRYYQATRKPIHVAVAYTADAAAASLTIAALLKASLILYDIQPIATNEELRNMITSANLTQDYAKHSDADLLVDEFFLLIGLGAAIPLGEYFSFSDRHIVVLLDSYRPMHLSNLRELDGHGNGSNSRLLVWGRERVRDEVDSFFRSQREAAAVLRRRRRRKVAVKRRQRIRSRYGDDGNGGGGDGSGDDNDINSSDSDINTSGSNSSDDNDDEDESLSVPQSQDNDRVDWMDPADVPPYLEAAYYACERAGRSCAVEAHNLAVLLNRYKDATLWHAAVGVCDLFTRGLMDYGSYLVEMRPLHDAVTLQRSVRSGGGGGPSSSNAGNINHNNHQNGDDDGGESGPHSRSHLHSRSTNAMQLHNRDEEQLHLLRHASLWSAIWHHPLTAAALRLHHADDGEGMLRQLLARCGVSFIKSRQPWLEVPLASRRESLPLIQRELQRYLERYGDLARGVPNEVRCVSRSIGFSAEVSTFDVCTLHEALLAACPPRALSTLPADYTGDAAATRALVANRFRHFHREQFWKARAVVDMDASSPDFAAAVDDAVDLQETIAVATSALMQPGMLQSTAGLHYTIPSDPTRTTTALETFGTVFRVAALARRLLLTLTVERGLGRYTRAVRPLLLSCAIPKPALEEADSSFGAMMAAANASATAAAAAAVNAYSFTATSSGGRGGGNTHTVNGMLTDVPTNTLPSAAGSKTSGGNNSNNATNNNARPAAIGNALGGIGSGGGGGFDPADAHEFIVVLAHEGSRGSALVPIPAMGRFARIIADHDEFDALPDPSFVALRAAVVVANRPATAHLADAMHLSSLSSRWDPRREYMAAVAEAQQPYMDNDDDDNDDDDENGDDDDRDDGGNEHEGDGKRRGGEGPGDDDADGGGEDEDSDYDESRYFEQPGASAAAGAGTDDDSSRGPISVS